MLHSCFSQLLNPTDNPAGTNSFQPLDSAVV